MEGVYGWGMGATLDRMVWVVTEGILKRFNWDMRGKSPPAKNWGRVQRKGMYLMLEKLSGDRWEMGDQSSGRVRQWNVEEAPKRGSAEPFQQARGG